MYFHAASTNVKRGLRIIKYPRPCEEITSGHCMKLKSRTLTDPNMCTNEKGFWSLFFAYPLSDKNHAPPKNGAVSPRVQHWTRRCFFVTFSIRRQVIKKTEKVRKWHKNARLERLEWRAGWWFLWGWSEVKLGGGWTLKEFETYIDGI